MNDLAGILLAGLAVFAIGMVLLAMFFAPHDPDESDES